MQRTKFGLFYKTISIYRLQKNDPIWYRNYRSNSFWRNPVQMPPAPVPIRRLQNLLGQFPTPLCFHRRFPSPQAAAWMMIFSCSFNTHHRSPTWTPPSWLARKPPPPPPQTRNHALSPVYSSALTMKARASGRISQWHRRRKFASP